MTNGTNITEELGHSDQETMVSKDRFSELLFKLEQDLEELKKENEEDVLDQETKKEHNENLTESEKENKKSDEISEDEDSEKGLLDYHFKELEKLKKISTLSLVQIKHIKWFFSTALFVLMNEMPESFDIKPIEIYNCMLDRVQIKSKQDFHKHLKVLLDEKTMEKEFPFVRFFPVLSAAKKRKSSVLGESFSPEVKRIQLSPLSLESQNTSFKS